ncbi:uncharacterized protein [Dysidea avara]|uniref:uncharacterized protein n=1 Tax=Dysidea avara TaxID=196820 RepID=UPI0033223A72
MTFLKVIALLLLFAAVTLGTTDLDACTFKADNGMMYDLSPLRKREGSYSWTETVWNTAGNLYYNTNFGEKTSFFIQLQICGNVSNIKYKSCNVTSPVYLAASDGSSCLKLGSTDSAVFKLAPFGDGLYLDYYDGESVDHITNYEARVYIICNKGVEVIPPQMEHMKDSHQVHFKMHSKHACPM